MQRDEWRCADHFWSSSLLQRALFIVSLAGLSSRSMIAFRWRSPELSGAWTMLEQLGITSGLIRERSGSRDLDSSVSVISQSSPQAEIEDIPFMTGMRFVYCINLIKCEEAWNMSRKQDNSA